MENLQDVNLKDNGVIYNAQETEAREICPNIAFSTGPSAVTKRNERERNRVRLVNEGFTCLRQKIPFAHGKKRLSKVETLRYAVDYIKHLQRVIKEHDDQVSGDVIERRGRSTMLRLMSTRAQERWNLLTDNGRKFGTSLRNHNPKENVGGKVTE